MHKSSKKDIRYCPFLAKAFAYNIVISLIFSTVSAIATEPLWQTLLEQGDNDINQQKLVQAENHFRQALKEIQHTSHKNDDLVKCIERLASTLVLEDKINEATSLYHKSLQILEDTYGKDNLKVIPTLFALGSIFEAEGDPKIAMKYYQRALAINEKHYGPLSPAVAESLHRLGHATLGAGQTEQAEHHYKSSLAILMQQPSLSSSKELERLLSDYNDLLKKNDTSDKNLISDFQNEVLKDRSGFPVPTAGVPNSAWQKQMTDISAKALDQQNNEEQQILLRGFKQPFNDSTLKPAFKTMSDTLHHQHPYKQGEEYYERMIAIDIKALGPNHPTVADDLTGLALLYISQERYLEAKPLLIRALSIYEAVYGSDNLLVTRTRTNLALVVNKLGEPQQAVTLYNDAIDNAHIALNPNDLETSRMLNQLGFLYYSQGKLEDARTIYQWALASTKGAVGNHNILVAACLIDYANVLRRLGYAAEANKMEEEALRIKFTHFDIPVVEGMHHD